jgi:hypothetical protein
MIRQRSQFRTDARVEFSLKDMPEMGEIWRDKINECIFAEERVERINTEHGVKVERRIVLTTQFVRLDVTACDYVPMSVNGSHESGASWLATLDLDGSFEAPELPRRLIACFVVQQT